MNRRMGATVAGLMVILLAMIGLVIGSVPLYRAFCRATGIGGAPKQVEAASSHVAQRQWRFAPQVREMKVHLGEDTLAIFTATNLSDKPITGNAVYNATPDKIGRYVSKIQCFCFTEQVLEPGQSVDMAVSFVIDPAMATDPNSEEVGTITLSYTFFNSNAPDGRGRS